jgi:alkylated DNA repair dioxygenase AlkB
MKRKRDLENSLSPASLHSVVASPIPLLEGRLEHVSQCIEASKEETTEMIRFMRTSVNPTPNPRNPATNLLRKQCTFILPGMTPYRFGQYNQHFVSTSDEWPPLVRRVFEDIRLRCADRSLYTGVHVNLYENGAVGVNPHSDKEDSMLKGLPIYSVTFLEDPLKPRSFSVYHRDQSKICDIPLGHGDLVVMKDMQDDFLHGIEKHRPFKAFRPRLNFTVRAFRVSSEV